MTDKQVKKSAPVTHWAHFRIDEFTAQAALDIYMRKRSRYGSMKKSQVYREIFETGIKVKMRNMRRVNRS